MRESGREKKDDDNNNREKDEINAKKMKKEEDNQTEKETLNLQSHEYLTRTSQGIAQSNRETSRVDQIQIKEAALSE